MKAISAPQMTFGEVFDTCVNSIADQALVHNFNAIRQQLDAAALDFISRATRADLFQITGFIGNENSIVAGQVTKADLKGLYTNHMVPAIKPARTYYDKIKMSAPFSICPYCGFGHVTTLDHYLAKANYPWFSVLPINLVPSCADCNKGKSNSLALSKEAQSLHPYFDHSHFVTEQWLFAEIEQQNSPTSIIFFTSPPQHWPETDKARVRNHFIDFKLASRFKIQAAPELALIKDELEMFYLDKPAELIRQVLNQKYITARSQQTNWWRTALFQALSTDDWFCNGGFR